MTHRTDGPRKRFIIYGLVILAVVGGYAVYDTRQWKREMAARMRLGPDVAPHPYGPSTVPAVTGFTKADVPAAAAAYARFKIAQVSGDLKTVRSMMIGDPAARRDIELDMREAAAKRRIEAARDKSLKRQSKPEKPPEEWLQPHFGLMEYRVGKDIIVATNAGALFIGLRKVQEEWRVDMDYPAARARPAEEAEVQAKRVAAFELFADDAESGKLKTIDDFILRRRAAERGEATEQKQ